MYLSEAEGGRRGKKSKCNRGYNVFNVIMVIRHAKDGKMYLYDIMNIKKKRAPFSSPKTLLSKKPISWL